MWFNSIHLTASSVMAAGGVPLRANSTFGRGKSVCLPFVGPVSLAILCSMRGGLVGLPTAKSTTMPAGLNKRAKCKQHAIVIAGAQAIASTLTPLPLRRKPR
jgi:hypothetical protein